MDDKFNELDDLDDVEIDLNLDDVNTIDDYNYDYDYDDFEYDDDYSEYDDDYFSMTSSSYERLEDDNYSEYNDEEIDDFKESSNSFRNLILKVVVLLLVVILVIWGILTLVNPDKKEKTNSNDVTVIKTDEINVEETFSIIKEAAIKYYKEDNINDELGQELSLKKLKKSGLIDKVSNSYNLDKSNVVLSLDNDKHSLKILLIDNNGLEKSKVYSLDNYSYCTSTYLCEEQGIDVEVKENESVNDTSEEYLYEYVLNGVSLTEWSKWTEYERTDCNTQKKVCSANDSSCLTEVKLFQRKEKVGTHNKIYESSRLAFSTNNVEQIKGCTKYDYVKINGVYYKTDKNSNYKVLGAIKNNRQSDYYNWKYNGRASYMIPPSDTITTRYVFVGPDYTNCTNTCNNNLKYYYDSYTFSKTMVKTDNPSKDCSNKSSKVVANYSISSQKISFSREEELYGTVCYRSYRTRSVNNSSSVKWSYYNDQELLNNGYKYTGNKKEK